MVVKMFKLAYTLFFNKFYSNLFVLIQIAIFVGFGNFSIGIHNYFYYGYDSTYAFENAEYFCSTISLLDKKLDYDFLDKYNCIVEFIPAKYLSKNTYFASYEKNTLECYKKYLIKGKWITDVNVGENIINCLTIENTDLLGKTIQKRFNEKDYTFYVCGVLSKNCKNIISYAPNLNLTPGDIFIDYNLSYVNLICEYKYVSDFIYNSTISSMVFFDKNYDECKKYLSYSGFFLTMEDLRKNVNNSDACKIIDIYSYVAYGVGILGLISMTCMLILNIYENENCFYTYKKLGLQKKHLILICLMYLLIIFLFLTVFSIISFYVWKILNEFIAKVLLNYKNLLFNIACILIISIITIWIFFNRLYKKVNYDE